MRRPWGAGAKRQGNRMQGDPRVYIPPTGRGHVLGGFAFCDASFPSGFSFWKARKGSVSEGASWSEARAQPASSPRETFSLERAEPATPVVHALHSADDAREAGSWDACAVAGRNGLRVTMHWLGVLDLLLKPCLCLASQSDTPQLSKSHGQPEPLDTAGSLHFAMVPSPQSSFVIFELALNPGADLVPTD